MAMRWLMVIAVLCSAGFAQAATLYVVSTHPAATDAGPGSASAPWKTLLHAAWAAPAGSTVVVSGGPYLHGEIVTNVDGTATAPIVFAAAPGATVQTDSWLLRNHFVTIQGFVIDGGQIHVQRVRNCKILNNTIHYGYIWWEEMPEGASSTCTVANNRLYGAASGAGGADWPQVIIFGNHHTVANNEIGPANDIDAFRVFGGYHTLKGNYVHDLAYSDGSAAHMDMLQTFGDRGYPAHDILVEANIFVNSEGQLWNLSQDGLETSKAWTIRNNVFANIGQNANSGVPDIRVYNNTFFSTGMQYLVTGGPGTAWDGTGFDFRGNIVVGGTSCGNKDFDSVFNNPSGLPMTRAHNFYTRCNGTAYVNYVSEVGGINGGAPGFINAAALNFQLTATSKALDASVALPGFSTDLLGKPRPAGKAWDIGAYERQ